MSKSGRKYRDPNVVPMRGRKAGPHEPAKRKAVEEIRATELAEDIDTWKTGRGWWQHEETEVCDGTNCPMCDRDWEEHV